MQIESFDSFFDHVSSLGIRSGSVVAFLEGLSDTRRLEVLIELYALLPGPAQYPDRPRPSPFSFLASSTLSGHSHRGLAAVDSLARFAVLYADTVFIREPELADHSRLGHDSNEGTTLASPSTALAADLETLLHLEPLLRAGVVKLARNFFPMEEPAATQRVNEELQKILDGSQRALYDRFAQETSFRVSYIPRSKLCMSIATGPLDLIENPATTPGRGAVGHFALGEFPELSSLPSGPGDFRSGEVRSDHIAFTRLFEQLLHPILSDLGYVAVCSSLYRLNYLTDRLADMYALAQTGSAGNTAATFSVVRALTHDVPVVFGTPLVQLLRFREAEGEAFRVYRDALKKAVQESESIGPNKAEAVFSDVVQPELNKIDLAMKRNPKLLLQSSGRDVLFTTGTLSIALAAGLVSPVLASALVVAGGRFLYEAIKSSIAAFLDPKDAQANPYFFLWKARRALAE
jgi:hypothetical protein